MGRWEAMTLDSCDAHTLTTLPALPATPTVASNDLRIRTHVGYRSANEA